MSVARLFPPPSVPGDAPARLKKHSTVKSPTPKSFEALYGVDQYCPVAFMNALVVLPNFVAAVVSFAVAPVAVQVLPVSSKNVVALFAPLKDAFVETYSAY